jgi:hypothetical protein
MLDQQGLSATADYDLIYLAQHLLQLTPVTLLGAWVKGHYTGKKREIQHNLNEKVDDLASNHLKNPPPKFKPLKCPRAPPGYRVRLLFSSYIITSKFYHTLSKLKHDKSLKQHIMKKMNWTKPSPQSIGWPINQPLLD